jgi:hypothetical protein
VALQKVDIPILAISFQAGTFALQKAVEHLLVSFE